jgi:tetratricopeptide (TPR) repeat protein
VQGIWREILDVTNTGNYEAAEDQLLANLPQELNVFGIVWIFRLYKNAEKLEKWSTIEDLARNFIFKNNLLLEDSIGAQITFLISKWIKNQKQPQRIISEVDNLRQNYTATNHERIWLLVLMYHMTPYRSAQKILRAEEMSRSEPNNAYFKYVRAYHEEQFHRVESAIQIYLQAITLNPYFADAMINLGNCYNSIGDYENAVDWYDRALMIREDSDAIMNKTIALSNNGRYDNAIQTIDGLLEKNQTEEAILTKVSVYQRLDEPDLALNEFDNALKLNPKSGKILMLKACYLARLNREEEGFQLIDQAAEVDPKNDQVLIARAEYYQQYCNTEKSLEIFDEIISDPELNSAKVHYYKSKTLEDTNQLDEAVKELHKAINMDDSDNIDYYISLGSIYVRQNKLRLAEISFKKAAELLPCLEAFWELARVKERMGCYYDALDYYNMALKEDPLNDIVMITRNRLRTKIACGDDKATL